MKKKILTLLMAVALVVSFIPSLTFADGGSDDNGSAPAADNGVVFTKTAEPKDDGTVDITLEAYTTGTVTTTTTSKPVDIVLVLDQSGSMRYDFGKTGKSRQDAMKDAVTAFIDSADDNAESRMSIVTFNNNASISQKWTELDEAGKKSLKSAVDKLNNPNDATNVAAGMEQAKKLIEDSNVDEKIVIVFTDGVPTTDNKFSIDVANNALSIAKQLKGNGTKIYTVGIFDGADTSQLYGDQWNDWDDDETCDGSLYSKWGGNHYQGKVDTAAGNRFLNYLSSNFRDADEIGLDYVKGVFGNNKGFKITKKFDSEASGYYLTASNTTELNNVFSQISENEQLNPTIVLDENTALTDVISKYFTITTDSEGKNAIKVYTSEYEGNNEWKDPVEFDGAEITIGEDGKTVSVTGFDFTENFVSDTPRGDNSFYGKKLVVKINVTPVNNVIDANVSKLTNGNVPTNESAKIVDEKPVAETDVEPVAFHTVTYMVGYDVETVQYRLTSASVDKEGNKGEGYTSWQEVVPNGSESVTVDNGGKFIMPDRDVVFTCTKNQTPVDPTTGDGEIKVVKSASGSPTEDQKDAEYYVAVYKETGDTGNLVEKKSVKIGQSVTFEDLEKGTYIVKEVSSDNSDLGADVGYKPNFELPETNKYDKDYVLDDGTAFHIEIIEGNGNESHDVTLTNTFKETQVPPQPTAKVEFKKEVVCKTGAAIPFGDGLKFNFYLEDANKNVLANAKAVVTIDNKIADVAFSYQVPDGTYTLYETESEGWKSSIEGGIKVTVENGEVTFGNGAESLTVVNEYTKDPSIDPPVDPVDPPTPVDPKPPVTPVDPTTPTEPTTPDQPDTPDTPDEPDEPDQPVKPDKPAKPDNTDNDPDPADDQKTNDPDQPQTGDESMLYLYLLLAVTASGAIVCIRKMNK